MIVWKDKGINHRNAFSILEKSGFIKVGLNLSLKKMHGGSLDMLQKKKKSGRELFL